MSERVKINPNSPKRKQIFDVVDTLLDEGIVLLPTDSQYSLVCDYQNKKGMDRIRKIRQMGKKDHLSVMCHSLEHVSTFANLTDENFKLIKRLIPGPYTFILPATREVPRLLTHPKKRTVGIRVPNYPICLETIQELGRPVMAITAKLPDVENGQPDSDDRELYLSRFDKLVDLVVDHQQNLSGQETTILDLAGNKPELVRARLGMKLLREAIALQGYTMEETVPAT